MQTVLVGSHSLQQVPHLLKERGGEKVLLVTGRHFLHHPAYRSLAAALPAHRLLHPPEGLLRLEDLPELTGVDAVLVVGGGKAIDFAKGLIYRSEKKPWAAAVPTTAGSGSEATPFAVFYQGEEKISIEAESLRPQVVVLDDRLLASLPAAQRAISGADALAQCVEALWSRGRNDKSNACAIKGLQQLWQNLPRFVALEEGVAARVLQAAHFSGKAIAGTRTTGPHALSYHLTARHGVPHGQAVAFFLPLFFRYNQNSSGIDGIFECLEVNNAEEAATSCTAFFASLGLATRFTQLGLRVDVDSLLQSVNHQRFANNPVPFQHTVLKELIERYLC